MYAHERRPRRPAGSPTPPVWPPPAEHAWPEVERYLRGRGLDPALARHAGWYPAEWAGALRVVIPALTAGPPRFWQARAITEAPGVRRYESPRAPRGEAVVAVFPPGASHGTVLVEGPFDALAAAGEGYVGIAWMGHRPTPEALDWARALARPPVAIVADRDATVDALRIWRRFPGARYGEPPPPYKDLAACPGEVRRRFLHGLFEEAGDV